MKKGCGKVKGGAYERKVARQLGKWYYNDPNALYRTAGSGSRATIRSGVGLHPGDIAPCKPGLPRFPFAVECKHGYNWTFDQALKSPKTWLPVTWWEKLSAQALNLAVPLLIMRRTGGLEYVMMSRAAYTEIGGAVGYSEFRPRFEYKWSSADAVFVFPLSCLLSAPAREVRQAILGGTK